MNRRTLIRWLGEGLALGAGSGLAMAATSAVQVGNSTQPTDQQSDSSSSKSIRLFLCGDLMTGRGIDQILPHPGRPNLYEPYVRDARDYVALAEAANGPLRRPVDFGYIWGDVLAVLAEFAADLRIANLETSITDSEDYWRGKGINYRMHPANTRCLTAASLDCCVLANNHLLDWGYAGLSDTLTALAQAGIAHCGAGEKLSQAQQPAVFTLKNGHRVLVFSLGSGSSGIPPEWAANEQRPGVWRVTEQPPDWLASFASQAKAIKKPGDILLCSIHWGGNWGYPIPDYRRWLAHRLIDLAGVDIVHGHSSHHPLGIERYRDRLILYGCGDLLNDYEGIGGHRQFRSDLALLYLVDLDAASGRLQGLMMVPMQIRRMQLRHARPRDARWLRDTLDRESRKLDSGVRLGPDDRLMLEC
ncbi:CapA family protein [Marinobacterium arenosum]|uniref:CapA family protein n=1 Tax=Marinobacterium arenosum TaxID=2862496 RepID=UPI001C93E796|nr:CapA family protein [Marinobacterium arenosum]MBY4677289.1 CapA family protein [Marinobacterium arenosum]